MKQHRLTRKRHRLNPEDVRALCHEILPIGDGEMPLTVTGWTGQRGRWTRMEVDYPNGWRLSFGFDDAGKVRNVTSRLKFTVGKKAVAA